MDTRTFAIDFFELSFLAEACIPPCTIARIVFWHNLIDKYYHAMTKTQRFALYEWMNGNSHYRESLKNDEDAKIFDARFNPDNQYAVKTKYKRKVETVDAFLYKERYRTSRTISINEEHIIDVKKI
jgi:hypothetical protein